SAATSPVPRCAWRESRGASSARSRWTRSPSSSTARFPSEARSFCSDTACSPRTTRGWPTRSTTSSSAGSARARPSTARAGRWSMHDAVREALAGREAWVVGGAVRDELLGRPGVDLDVALAEPERAARRFARASGGAPFPLSERHGAWRVALDGGRTVDFTPLRGPLEDDLASRDFTINAIAVPLEGGAASAPFGGRAARAPPLPARDRAVGRGRARVSGRPRAHAGVGTLPRRRSGRAAPPGRRAGGSARSRDRPTAGGDRRGAGGGDDRDARGGARPRPSQRKTAVKRELRRLGSTSGRVPGRGPTGGTTC